MNLKRMRMLVVLAMVLCLAAVPACGPGGGDNSGGTGGAAGEFTGGVDGAERVLLWGADPAGGAPFVFYDEHDPSKVVGFEVDMMEAMAKHLNARWKMVICDWDNLLEDLKNKRSDFVMNGIEINDARREAVLFSLPYYEYQQQLTVRVADKQKYTNLDSLKGQKISTLSGAEANNVLLRAGWTDDLLVPFDDSLVPYTELENGRVEAVLQESMIAAFYAGGNDKLHNVEQTFAPGVYGVAFRKDATALKDEIEGALKAIMDNGELAAIYKRWKIWNDTQANLGVKVKDGE